MLQDFRFAARNLRRTPLFTTVAVLSLAFGIGANSAVFTVADQVLLRLLPVQHASELLVFSSPGGQSGMLMAPDAFSYPMYTDLRDNNSVFAVMTARFPTALNLTFGNRSERIQAEIVTGSYFEALGLRSVMGRVLTPEDDRVPGAHSVAVLTYDFWQSRFSGNRAILNQVLLLNGHPMQVIGVTAPGYRGFDVGSRTDVLVPTMMKAQMTPTWDGLKDRRVMWLQLIGRLKPGVTIDAAQSAMQPFYRALLLMEARTANLRSAFGREQFVSKPLLFLPAGRGVSDLRQELAAPLRILLGIVGLLLLIACANVANLLLARAVGRQKEIAIRLAVGASRFHLMRQLVAESVALSLAGGALGLIFAAWTVGGLVGMLANSQDLGITPNFDWRVFAFTFLLALLTGAIFGLAPAWQATSPALTGTLKDLAGSVSAGFTHIRMRKALVISQVALSLLMLIAAALFARSLHNLKSVDLGFRRDALLSFRVDPSLNGYSPERIREFMETLRTRLETIPGVRSASIGVNPVISDNVDMATIAVPGYQPRDDENMSPYTDAVGPSYFATLGIPLLAGREFTPADRMGAPKVAIVNEVFARYFFKNENPLGRRFAFLHDRNDLIEIVGVVRSSKYQRIDEKTPRVVYTPAAQEPAPGMFAVYARTASDPRAVFGAVRREVRSLDAALPVNGLRTMEEQVDESLSAQRLIATLSVWFGVLATLLAGIGLYGVMAYTVTRRTRELGIRLALGAGRRSMLALVMREVALLTGIGVAIAIPLALGLTRLIRAQLYGILPNDPFSIAGAAIVLIVVALLAGYIPAERATRLNPIYALRYE